MSPPRSDAVPRRVCKPEPAHEGRLLGKGPGPLSDLVAGGTPVTKRFLETGSWTR